jgi:hypothetical protein
MQRPLISTKVIILKIVRDLGLGDREIPWQDFVEWIGEGLQHIGAIGQLVAKEVDLEVEGFRAKLPHDFFSARPNGHIPYKIQGDNITVGFDKGIITSFRYMAFPVDEEGFPLVPDNISYHTALFWKVAMQLAIRGDLANKGLDFATCKNRWDWYCRQAGTQGQYSVGFANRFSSMLLNMIPVLNHHDQDFNVVNGDLQNVDLSQNQYPLGNPIPKQWTPKPSI